MLGAGCKWTIQEDIWEQEHDTKLERRKLQHFKNQSITPVQTDPQRKCLPVCIYSSDFLLKEDTVVPAAPAMLIMRKTRR